MYREDKIKPFIIQTMVMKLSEQEALKYLADKGFDISRPYFYKLKKQIKESRFDRLNLIAKHQFVDQHLERIDQLELVNQELWSLYRKETDIVNESTILLNIVELQAYFSEYYEASMNVLQQQIQYDKQQQRQQNQIGK